ncbi:hypothetical protein AAHC03_013140 [Spirometra sp. Aus1]
MASFVGAPRQVAAVARSLTIPISPEKVVSLTKRTKKIVSSVPRQLTPSGFTTSLPLFATASASCGPLQVRFSHVDVTNVPDFSAYRVKSTKDPHARSSKTELQRKVFSYTIAFAGTVLATTTAKYAVTTMVQTLGPSAKTLALASIEVNLAGIPEGKNLVVKWRNKPLFVRHRTQEEIERERAVPLSDLRDQQRDEDRAENPEWLVCIGVCTHLGCVPIANSGDYAGGFYCPCHGSHYDASGRIRKGPAPLNLEIPPYRFLDENTLVVG